MVLISVLITVKPVLKAQPVRHKNVVSKQFVYGISSTPFHSFVPEMCLMATVFQDRFHCNIIMGKDDALLYIVQTNTYVTINLHTINLMVTWQKCFSMFDTSVSILFLFNLTLIQWDSVK